MLTIPSVPEILAVDRTPEEELEEARAIQNVMLPGDALCVGPVTIAYKFHPVDITRLGASYRGCGFIQVGEAARG